MRWDVFQYKITNAQLAYDIVTPQLQAGYVPAQMDIEKRDTTIDIKDVAPQVVIDGSECQAEEGHKTIAELTQEFAQQGIQDAKDAASETTEEWNELSNVVHDHRIFQEVAFDKAKGQQKEYGLSFIPSQPPKISFTDSKLYMDIEPKQININWDVSTTADIKLVREGSVHIYLSQYPSIQTYYVGDNGNNNGAGFNASA